MNKFYSANGNINKYNIIEGFDSPNEGVSIIAHLIESESYKNKVIELEDKITDLEMLITNKTNEVKSFLSKAKARFFSRNSF